MDFKEKIDKLLSINENKSMSIQDLELKCGLGMNTIRRAYNENRELGRKATMKILETFHISRSWWETGTGKMIHTDVPSLEKNDEDYAAKLIKALEDTNEALKREVKYLRSILKSAGIEV